MGYLVLSRKVDQAIIINHNIRVAVVEIRGDKVRIAVDAPKEITVHRDEIEDRITGSTPQKPAGLTPPVDVPDSNNVPAVGAGIVPM